MAYKIYPDKKPISFKKRENKNKQYVKQFKTLNYA